MVTLLLFTVMVGIGAGFVVVRRKRKAGATPAVTH
jgi:F0F1-type ATP synthase assembly protein I